MMRTILNAAANIFSVIGLVWIGFCYFTACALVGAAIARVLP